MRRCFHDGQFEQAGGIAWEARRLDKVEAAVQRSPDSAATLDYALRVTQSLVVSREFRFQARMLPLLACTVACLVPAAHSLHASLTVLTARCILPWCSFYASWHVYMPAAAALLAARCIPCRSR